MLVIRDEQLEHLEQAQFGRFEGTLATHLRLRFPQAEFARGPEQLIAFVHEGIQAARTFGVTNQYDVRRFLEFRAEYGPEFFKLQWAAKILSDPGLSGCGKMERLDDYSFFTLRQ